MIELAFYKANKGKLTDKIIGLLTRSKYSHVEINIENVSYSSSMRDGGVRRKVMWYDPEKWDIVKLDISKFHHAMTFFYDTDEKGYDTLGALCNLVLGIKAKMNADKWYCSEWVITALNRLGYKKVKPYESIKKLYDITIKDNIDE